MNNIIELWTSVLKPAIGIYGEVAEQVSQDSFAEGPRCKYAEFDTRNQLSCQQQKCYTFANIDLTFAMLSLYLHFNVN